MNAIGRSVLAFANSLAWLVIVRALLGDEPVIAVVWAALGMAAGAIDGRPRRFWIVVIAAALVYPLAQLLQLSPRLGAGIPPHLGPFWWFQALVAAIVLTAGYLLGASLGGGRRPWTVGRASWAGASRRTRAAIAGVLAIGLLAVGGYTVYAGVVGSDTFLHPDRDANCQTPAQAYGWTYEAINYDISDDAALAAANSDSKHCTSQGAAAGTAVVSPDGVRIAGWYIPSGDRAGPTGPTIVVVHGWHGNKSGMLPYAAPLHEQFNLVLIDLRDNGRSSTADVTMGLREQTDLEAMIDWLVATKQPRFIGALGNSMGGATVLAAASHDPRIAAILLESTHASLVTSGGNIVENEHGYPAQPGGWAIAAFTSLRLGLDVTSIDPIRTIRLLGNRPVLLVHGTADTVDYPATSAELNLHAALDAGVPAELVYCPGGRHGNSVGACPILWVRWANAFFETAAGVGGPGG